MLVVGALSTSNGGRGCMNMKTCADMYVFPMRYRVVQKFPLLYRRLRKSWNGGFADYAAGISLCGISSYVERLCGRSSEVFRMCCYKRTPHFSRDTLCLPMLRKIGMVVDRRQMPQRVVDFYRRCDVFFTTLKESCIGDEDDGILH